MIDQFGKVMVYVNDPRVVADFWVNVVGFTEVDAQENAGKTLSVEVVHDPVAGVGLVLFDRAVVAQMSPELDLATPSILFGSNDLVAMRDALAEKGVAVGELANHGGSTTFNFPDPEGNYFAVQQLSDPVPTAE